MNRRFATVCLVLTASLIGIGNSICPLSANADASGASVLPVLPAQKLKAPVKGVEIYQLDDQPIAGRRPLLLVHGLLGENWPMFRWGDVTKHLVENKDFNCQYKVFMARYDTVVPLASVITPFREAISSLYKQCGERQITVVALSMGGNIVQQSMAADQVVAASIEKVLTMGTPFHGSPLFTYDWMKYGLLTNHRVPWVKADLFMSYHLYFQRHQNLLSDLSWDNVDKNIPNVGLYTGHVPWRVRGDLTPTLDGNTRLPQINAELKVDKSKFITYGGYLVAPWANADRPTLVEQAKTLPIRFVGTTVPYHFGREHPVLRVLNREISWVPPRADGSSKVSDKIMYGLNDGITPVASALFLPANTFKDRFVLSEGDVSDLGKFVDVRKARVFRNIDHLTYIDGYRPRGASALLHDDLHPADGDRSIFEWILSDILDRDTRQPVTATKPQSATAGDP